MYSGWGQSVKIEELRPFRSVTRTHATVISDRILRDFCRLKVANLGRKRDRVNRWMLEKRMSEPSIDRLRKLKDEEVDEWVRTDYATDRDKKRIPKNDYGLPCNLLRA